MTIGDGGVPLQGTGTGGAEGWRRAWPTGGRVSRARLAGGEARLRSGGGFVRGFSFSRWANALAALRRAWFVPRMSITATVENDMIRLPADVHLPDGTQVRLEPIPPSQPCQEWPAGYFARTAGMLTGECLERPEQGSVERREDWRNGVDLAAPPEPSTD